MKLTPIVPLTEAPSCWYEADLLVDRVRGGEERASIRLLELLTPTLTAHARHFSHNRDDQEELVSEILFQLLRAFPGFRGDSTLKTFVFAVAHRTCLANLRKFKRAMARFTHFSDMDDDGSFLDRAGGVTNAEDDFESLERQRVLTRSISLLPEEQRVIFLLAEVQGLSYQAIADCCHIPLGTVRSRLARAKEKLQKDILGERELFARGGNEVDNMNSASKRKGEAQ